jgi:hypothetical protein
MLLLVAMVKIARSIDLRQLRARDTTATVAVLQCRQRGVSSAGLNVTLWRTCTHMQGRVGRGAGHGIKLQVLATLNTARRRDNAKDRNTNEDTQQTY